MLERFYPREYYPSTFSISFDEYLKKGYRVLLFDIDNTLVGHGAPADERAEAFFKDLRSMGFKTCLISNNSEARVKSFADEVGSYYIYGAGKPKPMGYEKAMSMLGSSLSDTLFVGDQIFTDIWGANSAGIYSILVKPLGPDPLLKIKLKRIGEKIVLFFYKHSKYYNKKAE